MLQQGDEANEIRSVEINHVYILYFIATAARQCFAFVLGNNR